MMNRMLMGASIIALSAAAGNAKAEDVTQAAPTNSTEVTSSGERMAADHAPLGIRAGAFLVIPKVDLSESYNDNIYATSNNTESDFVTVVKPEVSVRSNWSRHAVNAVARGDFRRFADNGDEDQDNYNVAADGRLDVLRDTSIGGGVSYSQDHEDRGDPNTIGAPVEPVEFNTTVARVGAFRGLGRANARLDSEVKKLTYENGETSTGGVIDNGGRDRNEYTQTVRLGYQLNDRFEAFVRGNFDNRVYDRKTFNRTNRGQTYTVGSAFDISGKTKGEVFGGYATRSYTNTALPSIDEAVWGGKVTWNATDLTSVIASVDRGIEETTLAGSSGFVNTDYRVGVEHALTRDILLKGNVGFANTEYQGAGSNQRDDDIVSAGLGVDYWMNRCLKAGLSYNYTDRDSNVTGGSFDRNAIMLKLTATY